MQVHFHPAVPVVGIERAPDHIGGPELEDVVHPRPLLAIVPRPEGPDVARPERESRVRIDRRGVVTLLQRELDAPDAEGLRRRWAERPKAVTARRAARGPRADHAWPDQRDQQQHHHDPEDSHRIYLLATGPSVSAARTSRTRISTSRGTISATREIARDRTTSGDRGTVSALTVLNTVMARAARARRSAVVADQRAVPEGQQCLAVADRVAVRPGQPAVRLRQPLKVTAGQLPDLGERRQAARYDPSGPHDRLQQALAAGDGRLVGKLDHVFGVGPDSVHLFGTGQGRLVAGDLDLRDSHAALVDVGHVLVDAAERSALHVVLDRAGPDADAGPDPEGVEGRPLGHQLRDAVLVEVAAAEDAAFLQAGLVQNHPHVAAVGEQVAAVEPDGGQEV